MKYYIVFDLEVAPNRLIKKVYNNLAAARATMKRYPAARMKIYESESEASAFYYEQSDDDDGTDDDGTDDDEVKSQENQEFKTNHYIVFNVQVAPNRFLKLYYHDLMGAQAILLKHPEAKIRTFESEKEALDFYCEESDEEDDSQEKQNQDSAPTYLAPQCPLERIVENDEPEVSEWL